MPDENALLYHLRANYQPERGDYSSFATPGTSFGGACLNIDIRHFRV
jgi:hypothetical protein